MALRKCGFNDIDFLSDPREIIFGLIFTNAEAFENHRGSAK